MLAKEEREYMENIQQREDDTFLQTDEERLEAFWESSETVPINQARMLDKLVSKDEEVWTDLVQLIEASEEPTFPQMLQIWKSSALPRVYADRAMLVINGSWAVKKFLGFKSVRGGASLFGHTAEQLDIDQSSVEYQDWFNSALLLQEDTKLPILEPTSYLHTITERVDEGDISIEHFEEILEQIVGIKKYESQYSRHLTSGDEAWCIANDSGRIPIIADILNNELGSMESSSVLKRWAIEQLGSWLLHRIDPANPLPTWMNTASKLPDDYEVSTFLAKKIFNNNFVEKFGWDRYKLAVNALGWGAVRLHFDAHRGQKYPIYQDLEFAEKHIADLELRSMFVSNASNLCQQMRESDTDIWFWCARDSQMPILEEARDYFPSNSPEYIALQNEIDYKRQVEERIEGQKIKTAIQNARKKAEWNVKNANRDAARLALSEILSEK